MNIIFIEGVSGVGKSTAVSALGKKLSEMGFSVKCHYEGDSDSPLDLCWTAYLTLPEYEKISASFSDYAVSMNENIINKGEYVLIRYQIGRIPLFSPELHDILHGSEFCYNPQNILPLSKFTEVFLRLWSDFGRSGSKYDYEIFDASLVSHMTNDLISNYNAGTAELVAHLNTLLNSVMNYNPIVFYLSSNNVRERLTKARESRRQSPLNAEKIRFWEKRKEMDLLVLPKLCVKVIPKDISKENWDDVIQEMFKEVSQRFSCLV